MASFEHPVQGIEMNLTDPETDDEEVAIKRPGAHDCPICGKTLQRCPQRFTGTTQQSNAGMMYGYPSNMSSCSWDVIFSVFQMVFHNMNDAGKAVFATQHLCRDCWLQTPNSRLQNGHFFL